MLIRFTDHRPNVSQDPDSVSQSVEKVFEGFSQKRPFMGWVGLPGDRSAIMQSKAWLKGVKKSQTRLCVLGIGGSSLGARAVYDFLEPKGKVEFFENVDGYAFEKRLSLLDLKKCHFAAISKSGETSETIFQLAHICEMLRRKKLRWSDHITVMTEEKPSTLKTFAIENQIFTLPIPFDVGGRFSVFSNVGIAPLLWAGIDVKKLLVGAKWAQHQKEMIADISRAYLGSIRREEWISVFWIYVEGLRTFGLWLEQLWAESLAKAADRKGKAAPRSTTPLTCIGATDQHSLLQQFSEGARDKYFTFIRSAQSEQSRVLKAAPFKLAKDHSLGELLKIEAHATQSTLAQLGLGTCTLKLRANDEESIGALLSLFEMVVATLGECLDVNAFDQPGVEAVKRVMLGTLGDDKFKNDALKITD